MMTFAEFLEKKIAAQIDEGFFGMFSSPLSKLIDAHPAFQSLAQKYDRTTLAKIKRALEADLGRSGNDPATANGRVTLNGLIGQTLERWAGGRNNVPLDAAGVKASNPMSYRQRVDYDGNYDRLN